MANAFSGDKEQLVPIIQAAIAHQGFAFINIISPCVTFNNAPGSTKAYDYMRQHMAASNHVDYVPPASEITAQYEAGSSKNVTMHDGSVVCLQKMDPKLDIHSRRSALSLMQEYKDEGKVLTGLLFIDPDSREVHDSMNTTTVPLRYLDRYTLCPGADALKGINQTMR